MLSSNGNGSHKDKFRFTPTITDAQHRVNMYRLAVSTVLYAVHNDRARVRQGTSEYNVYERRRERR